MHMDHDTKAMSNDYIINGDYVDLIKRVLSGTYSFNGKYEYYKGSMHNAHLYIRDGNRISLEYNVGNTLQILIEIAECIEYQPYITLYSFDRASEMTLRVI